MKKTVLFPALLLSLVAGIFGFVRHASVKGATGFAVVELFTSEGCSSCPPADKALAQLAGVYPQQVYTLEFHVDYWNRLGWKDIYSAAGYTQRQKDYAQAFNLESIYTPEAVVNGQKEFVGSDQDKLDAAVKAELSTTTNTPPDIGAIASTAKKVVVKYNLKESGDAMTLHFALVQLKASSQVLRGENEGLHLQHINVVRDFRSVTLRSGTALSGSAELTIPDGLQPGDCKIIAFLQNPTGRITGAATCGIIPSLNSLSAK